MNYLEFVRSKYKGFNLGAYPTYVAQEYSM